jgi:uncharacterized phage-associated protein
MWFLSRCFRGERGRAETKMPLNFKPQFEKIVELLLYLAHKRPNADKYQAVKFFYLADSEHLNRYGRPITFETYFALPFGPVASHAMDLLEGDARAFEEAGIEDLPFEIEVTLDKRGKPITYIREPKRNVDLDVFSKSDLKVFDEILRKYGDKTFDELFRITHDHPAYVKAWGRRGAKKNAAMRYDEMVDDAERRSALLDDLEPVAAHME